MSNDLGIDVAKVVGGSYNNTPKALAVNEYGAVQMVAGKGANGIDSDMTNDVWGNPVVAQAFSLFHGLFTYNIPSQIWLKFHEGTETTSITRIYTEDGAGVISSGTTLGNNSFLRSKRHPRYQPDRAHNGATALFLPTPSATGKRQWCFKNTTNGAYFQLENGTLYAVILDGGVEKVKEAIDLSVVGLTASDLQYGHLYDIQFQWRGVGDYWFFIDKKIVHKTSFLGTNTTLTIRNPAMSYGFYSECTEEGTEVKIVVGCVDISSLGGKREGATYVAVSNDAVKAVNTADYPVLIAHIKETIQENGTGSAIPNTRDVLALRATGSSDQKSRMKAYLTRDGTAITGASYSDAQPGSGIEFDTSATAINTANCQRLWRKRVNIDDSEDVDLPSDLIDFILSEGDYLIITMERESPTQTANVEVSLEMGEEI